MRAVNEEYNKTFKTLYYDLYSNGNSSRAERIVSDVTKLLLCKLACENADISILENYLLGTKNLIKAKICLI